MRLLGLINKFLGKRIGGCCIYCPIDREALEDWKRFSRALEDLKKEDPNAILVVKQMAEERYPVAVSFLIQAEEILQKRGMTVEQAHILIHMEKNEPREKRRTRRTRRDRKSVV